MTTAIPRPLTADAGAGAWATMARVTRRRLLPMKPMLCYFIAYLDRVNIGFAGADDEQGPRAFRRRSSASAAACFFSATSSSRCRAM